VLLPSGNSLNIFLSIKGRSREFNKLRVLTYCSVLIVGNLLLCIPEVFGNTGNLEIGRDIFFKHCKACHGNKGDGKTFAANVLNPPPKNFTSEKSKHELTEKRIIESVTEGRKGTAMMPWKTRLTRQEIKAVANYIKKELMDYP
jgi:mono/diheme cytochrome c family protein